MKNKVMMIGAIDAGKTTLVNELVDIGTKARKTQSLEYHDWVVDTPGEYTENPLYYKNIMATSFQVTHVAYVQDATTHKNIFPPGFGGGVPKLPIGIITKADAKGADIERSFNILKRVMLRGPVIITSVVNKTGLKHIQPLVICNSLLEMKAYAEKHNDPLLLYVE
ncbi:EutP/PduV family microcompartment system protein [Pseudogracilibacillus auburnensis]|uniref:Ethanolamine utilization protein EutP n=1 Tax=Pseudogracilibacillus auburnensis TaxID=1494959 RepID=A0A2V3VKU9_9BACI|nr:EutP/PduV family microcompartment system protein [Pseudogracilibacillus auburnensis]MBO1001453.1 ethanolamine utilization protein EutP [Pseudogracilibacillus auburnensis]PXW82452.1 ethanolamine utilization protein EutP [Pseudogracilibacillus auburnensis]